MQNRENYEHSDFLDSDVKKIVERVYENNHLLKDHQCQPTDKSFYFCGWLAHLKEARNSLFWPWSVSFEVKISHRR